MEDTEKSNRLKKNGWTVTDTGCWEWNGYRMPRGYGSLKYHSQHRLAHRLAHEAWVGPIPDGHQVNHRCDNPPCINPEHLYAGTQEDNMRDMSERSRFPTGENHWWVKLTESDVRSIRTEYAAGGVTQSELAKKFGVSQTLVSSIVRRVTWTGLGLVE